jgi:hypothetical protein
LDYADIRSNMTPSRVQRSPISMPLAHGCLPVIGQRCGHV